MASGTLKNLSWDNLSSALSRPNTRNAFISALAAALLGAAILPSLLLPSRFSTRFRLPPVQDVVSHVLGNKNTQSDARKRSLDKWIESERSYAWRKLLKNIGPPGTDAGCVVASPSKKDPDYWYQWTRDSAMVFKVVIEYWKRDLNPQGKEATFKIIMDYINESRKMQRMDTPSGGFKTGGLGEVKYHTDGTAYWGSWGRPQYDGPALRASAVISFCNELLDKDEAVWGSWVKTEIYDSQPYETTQALVKADLDFIAKVWEEPCFDLWEEVNAIHHFNMIITIRGLYDGSRFARRMGDDKSAEEYAEVARTIQDTLARFWDAERGYILTAVEAGDQKDKHSGLDTGTLLGFLHSGDLDACISGLALSSSSEKEKGTTKLEDNVEFLGSDKSLVTQLKIAESMRDIYSINNRYYPSHKNHLGYGVGRYQEDVYDGDGKRKTGKGNPWYLCTLANAEFYYRLAHYYKGKTIVINSVNAPFYLQLGYFDPKSSQDVDLLNDGQTYSPSNKEHKDLLEAFKDKGDAFMKVVRDQAKWNGGLWEQFNRDDGGEMGAPHLTWSYASFLSAEQARNNIPMFQ